MPETLAVTGFWKVVLSILFFPLFFQSAFLSFAWGAADVLWLMLLKRAFLLLPVLALILACWVSMGSLITTLVRHERSEFLMAVLVTWWDLGRATFAFWGGVFRFAFYLIASLFALIKSIVLGLWTLFQDLLLMPFRIVKNIGANMLAPGVPWIAVVLTVIWALLEAAIFTYVTTPLVMDTLSNMTGAQLSEYAIRAPLFIFMLFIVLGSYAVLANWSFAIRQKSVATILKIGVIELVVMFVEVIFLYREFVESLMPWFAQHGMSEPGAVGVLLIASLAWFGIRGISWFLFAAHGTPTLLAMIQGSGIHSPAPNVGQRVEYGLTITKEFVTRIREEMMDIQKRGDDLLGAFVVPPLQLVAAAINFCTLFLSGQHLFELPFRTLQEVMSSKMLLHNVAKRKIVNMPNAKPRQEERS